MEIFKITTTFILIACFVSCNKYTKDQKCTKTSDGNDQCEKNDKYVEDEDEPMFYDEEEISEDTTEQNKEKLVQWDPVKVCYLL